MTTITIRRYREQLTTTDIYGNPVHLDVLHLGTKGKVVAEVTGDIEPIKEDGRDYIRMGGSTWCVWQILNFARRGEHGLQAVAH